MSHVLFETVYNGDRHVFLDDAVVSFKYAYPLVDHDKTIAELEQPAHGGYIAVSYEIFLREEVGDYTMRDATEPL